MKDLPKRGRDNRAHLRHGDHLPNLRDIVPGSYVGEKIRRRGLEDEVLSVHGVVTAAMATYIGTICRLGMHIGILEKRLRNLPAAATSEAISLAKMVSTMLVQRDGLMTKLRLDQKPDPAVKDLFASVQPVQPAVAHQDAPVAVAGDDAGPVEDLFMTIGDEQHGHVGDQDGGGADLPSAISAGAGQPSYATHANTPPSF